MVSVRGRHRIDVGSAYDRRKIRRRFSRQRCKGAAKDREVGGDGERNLAIGKRVWRSGKEFGDRKRDQARCWQDAVRADEKRIGQVVDRTSSGQTAVGRGGSGGKGNGRRYTWARRREKRRKGYRKESCHD